MGLENTSSNEYMRTRTPTNLREYVKHVHDITDGFEDISVNRTLTEVRDAMWYGGGISETFLMKIDILTT